MVDNSDGTQDADSVVDSGSTLAEGVASSAVSPILAAILAEEASLVVFRRKCPGACYFAGRASAAEEACRHATAAVLVWAEEVVDGHIDPGVGLKEVEEGLVGTVVADCPLLNYLRPCCGYALVAQRNRWWDAVSAPSPASSGVFPSSSLFAFGSQCVADQYLRFAHPTV